MASLVYNTPNTPFEPTTFTLNPNLFTLGKVGIKEEPTLLTSIALDSSHEYSKIYFKGQGKSDSSFYNLSSCIVDLKNNTANGFLI